MHKLDDLMAIRALDRNDMYSHIVDLPEQFAQAWLESQKLILPSHYIRFDHVVLLGMGGSAIGGSLVKSLLLAEQSVPVTLVCDYTLPSFVGRNSLVVGVSYSGNTEETVTAFAEAAAKGAKLIAITSGGQIEKVANRYRAPTFRITYKAMPRAALAYLFVPLVTIFSKVGLLEFSNETMGEVVELMAKLRKNVHLEIPFSENQAKQLASKLFGQFIIAMAGPRLSGVARRWKTQMNENAKQAAFLEVAPELCHNTIVGLDFPRGQGRQVRVLLFPSRFDHPRNQLRMKILSSLLARKSIQYEVIQVDEAPNPFAEVAQLILWGDFVSYYLAILNGVDSTPVEPIERLKQELAKNT